MVGYEEERLCEKKREVWKNKYEKEKGEGINCRNNVDKVRIWNDMEYMVDGNRIGYGNVSSRNRKLIKKWKRILSIGRWGEECRRWKKEENEW